MPVTSDTSFVDSLAPNVAVQFLGRVASPDAEAYRFPRGDQWESVTWRRPGTGSGASPPACSRWASSPSSGSASSPTRYEWILADLAVMCAAGATTTVCPSTNAEDTAYILSDSEVPGGLRRGLRPDRQGRPAQERVPPKVTRIKAFDGAADSEWVLSLDDLAEPATPTSPSTPTSSTRPRSRSRPRRSPLIYTSGTTGKPKGVRLRHRSWVYEGAAIEAQGILSQDDLQFLWLRAHGPLVRQGPAVHPGSPAASRPPSTAGSRRSSTTSVS